MNNQPPDPPDHGHCTRCQTFVTRDEQVGGLCVECQVAKFEIEGSPTDGYYVWFTDHEGMLHTVGNRHDTPCAAWRWALRSGIDAEIVGFTATPQNALCPECAAYAVHQVVK